jgi:hypothetical protein
MTPDPQRPSPGMIATFQWSRTSPGAGWTLIASIARPGVSNCLWRKDS